MQARQNAWRDKALGMSFSVFAYGLLVIGVLVIFGQSIGFEFVVWDDDIHLYANTLMNPPTWRALVGFLTKPFFGLYIPVTYSFWLLLAWISGLGNEAVALNPSVFHAANVLLHVGNVCLVFYLIQRLLGNAVAAWIGAMVFAWHPLQVEAVAWVSGAKDLLSMFFSLLALLALSGLQHRSRRFALALVACVCFGLALLAKPAAVVLPLVGYVLTMWRGSDCAAITKRWQWGTLVVWILGTLPLIALTYRLQQTDIEQLPVTSVLQRLMVAGDALWFYAAKLIWPVPLLADYGRTPALVLASSWRFVGLMFCAGLVVLAGVGYQSPWRRLVLALAIAVAGLLPNLGVIPFAYQKISTVADRYAYGPMFGIALALAWVCHQARRWIVMGLAIGLALLGGWWSFQQAQNFRNTQRLFSHVVAHNPRSLSAHNNLGVIKIEQGLVAPGLDHLRAAVALSPQSYKTLDNIGVGLQMLGHIDDAVNYHRRAIAIEPRYATARVNLANAYRSLGRKLEAEITYQEALRVDPLNYLAHNNYGVFLENEGKLPEAEHHYRVATKLSTDPYLAYYNLGVLFEKTARLGEAAEAYKQALKLRPSSKVAAEAVGRAASWFD